MNEDTEVRLLDSPSLGGPRSVRARELRAGYGAQEVLHGVSFDLEAYRATVILGPGGGGKTTLLRALAPRLSPAGFWQRGFLSVPGTMPLAMLQRPEPVAEPLSRLLAPHLGAGDTAGEWLRRSWRCAPEAAEVLMPDLDIPLRELSGEPNRLAAFTLMMARSTPSILLLDEPEAGLERWVEDAMTAKLRELRGTRTVVLVTHNVRFARAVADDAILLIDGEVVEAAEASRFFDHPSHPRTRHFVRMGC